MINLRDKFAKNEMLSRHLNNLAELYYNVNTVTSHLKKPPCLKLFFLILTYKYSMDSRVSVTSSPAPSGVGRRVKGLSAEHNMEEQQDIMEIFIPFRV